MQPVVPMMPGLGDVDGRGQHGHDGAKVVWKKGALRVDFEEILGISGSQRWGDYHGPASIDALLAIQ